MTNNRIRSVWRPGWFVALHIMAITLLASWLWPVTRQMWDAIDAVIFRFLNNTLALGRGWSGIWAVGSTRYFDLVVALVIGIILLRKNIVFKRIEVRRALFITVGLMGILLLIRTGFNGLVDTMGWQRSSPSRINADAIRLSEQFPMLKKYARMKDSSPRSFPGDHASVLLLWGIFVAMFARGYRVIVPVVLTTLFIMPRLIAGAHWFTDVAVGGALLALLAMAWGYCTPITGWISDQVEALCLPLFERLRKMRPFRRISIIRGGHD